MNTIQQLINRLTKTDFAERYPEYVPDDGKTHVLYLAPYANGTALYRVILPMLHLNTTKTHAAIITGIMDWNYDQQFQNRDVPMDERLVKWAHYIVFPTVTSDLKDMIKVLLRFNPNLKFVIDVDDNIHKLHSTHPSYHSYTREMKNNLLMNISICNLVTGPNIDLLTFYHERARLYNTNSRVQFSTVYNLLSPYLVEDLTDQQQPSFDRVRIGLVIARHHFLNVNALRPSLLELQEKYGDKIEFIIMGWNGKMGSKDTLRGLKFTHIEGVPFINYFHTLQTLKLDIGIIPLRHQPEFNCYKAFQRWLEFAACKLPVVCGDSPVYSPLIKNLENGMVFTGPEQFSHAMHELIDNADYRQRMGKAAYDTAWNSFAWNNGPYLSVLQETFDAS